MILISHRGNITYKDPDQENNPVYIKKALNNGFHVEIDIWYTDKWFLGHDEPQYEIDFNFLTNPKFWCHAKNKEAFLRLKQNKSINCFWHDKDTYTLTSYGYIWCNINVPLIENSICVMPELGINGDIKKCSGICSDVIANYTDNGSK